VVDYIDAERGVVRVIVTIFGRSTPLDIEYWQIEKV
jgi:transcriptional antiterminator NusG